MAKVIDVLPLLDDLSLLHQRELQGTIEFLSLRQQLTDGVLLALFETTSAVAEVICERDRTDQLADQMDSVDASRVKSLTLASIMIGGVAAIVSGCLGLAGAASTASDAVGIGGGLFSTLFGGTALFTHSQEEFLHERNVLREVWENPPEPAIFSPSIWRYLHRRHPERGTTPRDELLDAWGQKGRLGMPGSSEEQKQITLLFGPGGLYSSAELRARANMLETLEATIRLIHEELELFIREISTTFAHKPALR